MEIHPRINISHPLINHSKIILGSFPTWALTGLDSDDLEIRDKKNKEKVKNGDMDFFYGSSINRFWDWYKNFYDAEIEPNDVETIKGSLNRNSIGITDIIVSCDRLNQSSLDKHLTNRIYNHNFFRHPQEGEIIKILCTSKGVMNEMFIKQVLLKSPKLFKIDTNTSNSFQGLLLEKIKGESRLLKNPFYNSIELESGGSIECCSIPSPGSPYRRLIDFGLNGSPVQEYLDSYLKEVFDWFKN